MMKKLISCLVLVMCMLCLQSFTKRAQAATTEIVPKEISSPGQVDTYKESDEGIVYSKEDEAGTTVYTFSILERGWFIEDLNGSLYDNDSFALYKNASLTAQVFSTLFDETYSHIRKAYYLDAGTYYLVDKRNNAHMAFAFFLPDSAAISHKLVKDKDNNGYTDTITFTPHLGTTYLASGIVDTKNIKASDPWNNSSKLTTNANDVYSITANGEYTVKAVFTDTEWKDFPVMYSFSIYDIGKDGESDKTSNDDTKKTEAKLNKTSETIKVGESFKLKVTGAKAVSFKSSKKSVAKVTSSGKVVGKKKGTATIKVTCDNGETYTCKVKVKK